MSNNIDLEEEGNYASLNYFHKYTLHALIELDIIKFRKEPKGLERIVEFTPSFKNLSNNFIENNSIKFSKLENVLQTLAKENRMFLKKSLKYDIIKLISFITGQTSLIYYNKNTLKYLIELNLVEDNSSDDKLTCELQLANHLSTLKEEMCDNSKNIMSCYEQVIKSIAGNKNIKLKKNILYDMIKMICFLDKFGENASICVK